MGEIEAVGGAVTGGPLARAVEPAAGEPGPDGHTHEKCCLNCGTLLTGPYCSACGQKAHVHRSLRAFGQDFIHGMMNFDGKFWRTLPMLAWRPGEMTRRYIAGERARYISPVALYLFTVFAMFAVLNFTGALGTGPSEAFREELRSEIATDEAALVRAEAERKAAVAAGNDVAAIDRRIAKHRDDIVDARKLLSGEGLDSSRIDEDTPSWVRPVIEQAAENPDLLMTNIQDAASKYSWLLIPISVPFVWLLFPFYRRYRLYDHTVFVTYSLSFMMVLVIASGLLVASGWTTLASLLFFVPPFHMYRHLKGAYELGRVSALIRTTLLVSFSFAAAGMFMAAAFAIGMM